MYVIMWSVDSFILGHAWIFLAFHCYEKKSSLCLLRGSLAYVFGGLFMLIQHVKRVCGKNVSRKADRTVWLNCYYFPIFCQAWPDFFRECLKCIPSKIIHQLSISDLRMLIPGKLKMQRKFIASFVNKINKIPVIISNWGDWWAAENLRRLVMFFHSQGSACMYFLLIERMLDIEDCNDTHFRSCY